MAYRLSVTEGESETMRCGSLSSCSVRPKPSVTSMAVFSAAPGAAGRPAQAASRKMAIRVIKIAVKFLFMHYSS